MNQRETILNLIKETVRESLPDANILLFGSRARGTARDDSDWDVLIIVKDDKITDFHNSIDYRLWQQGLEFNQEINTIFRTKRQWDESISLFKHNVLKEAIAL